MRIKLLETIKIIDSKPCFLEYHNDRLNHARKQLFGCTKRLDLAMLIQPTMSRGRCRVIYAEEIEIIEYQSDIERHFKSFQIVKADFIEYAFKYVNRNAINLLVTQKGLADDILIIKKGIVTDTAIANVAFWQGTRWITPADPLLKGTTRQRLLNEQVIFPEIIMANDLIDFQKMAMMNALIGFYVIENFVLHF